MSYQINNVSLLIQLLGKVNTPGSQLPDYLNEIKALLDSGSSGFIDPLTTNGDILARISGATTNLGQGANGTFLGVSGGVLGYYAAAGGGTVTTVSVITANGFTGTVANATSSPAITLTTNVTGILKGNGTAISAAIAADFPTLNQNTSGSAASLSATLSPSSGGTGINNGSSTITLGGNLTTSGSFTTTFTVGANTNVTLPQSGTLATLAGSESLTNKSVNGVTLSSSGSSSLYLTQAGTYAAASGGSGGGTTIQSITSSSTLNTASNKVYTIFVDATSGNVVLTLPTGDATTCHIIRRIDNTANTVTFSGTVTDFGTSGTNLLGNNGFIMTYNNTNFYAN